MFSKYEAIYMILACHLNFLYYSCHYCHFLHISFPVPTAVSYGIQSPLLYLAPLSAVNAYAITMYLLCFMPGPANQSK